MARSILAVFLLLEAMTTWAPTIRDRFIHAFIDGLDFVVRVLPIPVLKLTPRLKTR